MDKETLSNYGWIVICVLVLAVLLALSSPFGTFVASGVKSTTQGLFDTNQKALNTTGLVNIDDQNFDDGTIPLGGVYTKKDGTILSGNSNDSFPDTPATGDKYEYGDYEYRYNSYCSGSSWSTNTTQNGWGVRVKDDSKSSYGKILTKIAGKPITNMHYTFDWCTSLTTAPTIPNSVTNMFCTFSGCKSLITAPTIPNSVTNMSGTFWKCASLTTAPIIPNSVTNMNSTFRFCSSLITAPTIPNSVTNMEETFNGCTSLTTAPTIPNSVTDMSSTFNGCTALEVAPVIPSSVIYLSYAFGNCTALSGTITINTNTRSYSGCLYNTNITSVIGSTSHKADILATKS